MHTSSISENRQQRRLAAAVGSVAEHLELFANEPAKECRYRAKHYQTSNYWPAVHTLFEQLLQTVLLFLFFFFIWCSVIINATTLHEHPIKTQGIDHVIAKLILLMCHHLNSTSQHCDKRNSSEMEEGGMGNMKKVTENYKSQNYFGF